MSGYNYFGHPSRWLIVKRSGVWVTVPPYCIRAAFYAVFPTWREAMDHVIREAGL